MPQIPLKYLALRVQMHLWFLVFPVVKWEAESLFMELFSVEVQEADTPSFLKLGLNFFFSSFDTDEFDKLIVRTSPSDPEPSLGYAGIGLSCSGTSLYTEHLSSLSLSLHLYCHYCMSLTLCLLSPPQFVPLPFCFLHFSVLHTFLPHQHRVSNLWLLPNLNSA